MILTKNILITVNSKNKEKIEKFLGRKVENKEELYLPVEFLSDKSTKLITIQCDYCGKVFERPWYSIKRGRHIIPKDACSECWMKKRDESNLKKYGAITPLLNNDVRNKAKQTLFDKYGAETFMGSKKGQELVRKIMIEKYGVEKPFQNKEIKNKAVQTIIERFGEKGPLGDKETRKKIIETNKKRYGTENPMQNEKIKQRLYNSNIEKYGVPYQVVAEDFKKKRATTCSEKYGNQKIGTSAQQSQLSEWYDCELNKLIGRYYADLFFDNLNIIIEYDGGGHNLSVKMGLSTQEEFDRKENIRLNYLLEQGYKVGRIYNPNDYIINEDYAEEIKNKIFDELKNKDYFIYKV